MRRARALCDTIRVGQGALVNRPINIALANRGVVSIILGMECFNDLEY